MLNQSRPTSWPPGRHRPGPISVGSPTLPTSKPPKAGCTSPPFSIAGVVALLAGPVARPCHASLVLAALDDALKRRQPPEGLLHHSDRGSQYVDDDYIQALSAAGIERSMSRAGNCYDNAAMESFWSTLKTDTGLDESIPSSRRHAELAVFDYIETFYNPTRRHSSLGYLSPVAFENQQKLKDIIAA